MKIYLDNNLGVEKVEQEELTQDTYGYNILKVYIPNAVLSPYDTFTCYYGALLQNGRKVGWFAMEARTNSDADYEANYTLYKATLEQSVVSVEGKVYIGCQVILGNSGNATLIKKNTAVVQFNVRKSVAINNDILILDPNQTTTDVLESYKQLLENALTTYATKAEVNNKLNLKADKSDTYTKAQIDTKLDLKSDKTYVDNELSEKADKSNTYTKTEVDSALFKKANSENVYSKSQVDNLLDGKADKSDTYTKSDVYTKTEVNDKLNGYIKDNDTTYSATVRGKNVVVSTGAGNGSTTYGQSSIHTSNPRKPTCDYYFPEKSGTFAMTSDIPTVNDPRITFIQGGAIKGTIHLNQADNQSIAFEAGGGSNVVANPTLSGNEATLDGLEVDGTKYKVGGSGGGSNLLEDIVDKNGNHRFIGGNGIPQNVSGMTVVSSKWTLNGTNLIFEILGTFSQSLSADTDLCMFTLPEWIISKIPTPYMNIVDFIRFDAVYTNRAPATGFIQIYKSENAIAFKNQDSVTIEALTVFKIRYNIIIDNE